MKTTINAFMYKVDNPIDLEYNIRLYSSSVRYALNRKLEGKLRRQIELDLYDKFLPNMRYARSAISNADAIIKSRKETLKLQIKQCEQNLKNAKKLWRGKKNILGKVIKKPNHSMGLNQRIQRLTSKLERLK
nr:hypothetical protein [Bacteroidota bacterium]